MERCARLSAYDFARAGVLRSGRSVEGECDLGDDTIAFQLDARTTPATYRLNYTPAASGEPVEARGILLWSPTPCGPCLLFGCPRCGRRCAMLYLPPRASELACRRCHGLRYASENMTRRSRLERRAGTFYRRAGSLSLGATFTRKPCRMTWQRFNRLMDEAERLDQEAAEMASLPQGLASRLADLS